VPVLLRNLDLTPEPPTTFEDLLAAGQALINTDRCRQAFAVQAESFHLSTLFTSSDGEPFTLRPGSAWDPADPHRAKATATAALARLRSLGEQGTRALHRNLDEIAARQLFIPRTRQPPLKPSRPLACSAGGAGSASLHCGPARRWAATISSRADRIVMPMPNEPSVA